MNLKILRNIENGTYSTIISFESWGGTTLTSDEEKDLLHDFPIMLDYKDITFSGKYKLLNGVVVADEVAGDSVLITPLTKTVPLIEGFSLSYSCSVNEVATSELTGTSLNTSELVAEAKVILFEDKVKDKISSLMTIIKAKRDKFEDGTPTIVTI